jgi:hypothetical protein
MTYFAFAAPSHIRNAVLCALATLTLAACGGSSGSAATSAAAGGSDSVASLVSPNGGTIDRSSGVTAPTSAGTTTAGTPITAAVSSSGSTTTTTPAAGTTVASTPVKTTTTTGVATLDWQPPTENSDGSALTNLAGYTVYYGTSPDSLTQSLKVTNPGLTAYTVTNLSSGTWYFAVTSYSSTGVESTRTGTVSTTI